MPKGLGIGMCVKPLRKLKRPQSVWTRWFGHGKCYRVSDIDMLDQERVLVISRVGLKDPETGDTNYIVYPDEVKKVNKKNCEED